MRHLPTSVKHTRLAKKHIIRVCKQFALKGGYALKPYHIHRLAAIGKKTYQTHFGSFSDCIETDKPSPNLHRRHISFKISDSVHRRTVEVMRRKMVQKVVGIADAQLGFKKLGPFRTYSFHIFYAQRTQRIHCICMARMQPATARSAGLVIFILEDEPSVSTIFP